MLNAILLHMISCFICFLILALPVPTLTQVYLRGVFAWEILNKSALASSWGHLGEVFCTCWRNTTTRQHATTHKVVFVRTSHAKSPFSSSDQCP